MTIGEAIQIALRDHPDLQRSSNQVELGEISIQQSKAGFYPNLNLTASASRQFSKSQGQTSESFNTSVSSSFNLFNGFADVASLEQAKLNLDAGKLSFERQQETIIYETLSQFLQAVLNKEIIRIQRENLAPNGFAFILTFSF